MNKTLLNKVSYLTKEGYAEFTEKESIEVSSILDAILPNLGLEYSVTLNRKEDGSTNYLMIV